MATDWANAPKDPQAVRDYGIDWSADIGANTILASTWVIALGDVSGVVIVQDDHTTTTTTVRLSGGVVGSSVTITNHVTLSNGEEDDQTGTIKIRDR
jgi:hypothetical protein